MVCKGIIKSVSEDKKTISVMCPTIGGLTTDSVDTTIKTTVCSLPNVNLNISPGDVVFVGFENLDVSKATVLGYLYRTKSNLNETDTLSRSSDFSCESITVDASAVLPQDTSIGSITSSNIKNIKGVDFNVQDKLSDTDTFFADNTKKESAIKKDLSKIKTSAAAEKKSADSNEELATTYNKKIGNSDDEEPKTIFGRINNCIVRYEDLSKKIGKLPKNKTVRDLMNELSTLYTSVLEASQRRNTDGMFGNPMLDRAEKMISVTWSPSKSFTMWNKSVEYKAGNTYTGMPYTLWGGAYKFDDWQKKASSNYSTSGSLSGYGYRTGPAYGSCCADFVSEVLGIPHTRSCSGLAGSTEYLASVSFSGKILDNLQVGDVLWSSAHVLWCGAVSDNSVTLYEQTPSTDGNGNPTGARKSEIQKDNSYYNGYTKIYRPTKKTLNLECNKLIIGGGNWVCKGNKINNAYAEQSLTDTEYYQNAMCFWNMVKLQGWTACAAAGAFSNAHGESSGNPWGYGTGGGGLFGFTPFDSGNHYKTTLYDYSRDVEGDINKRWDGDTQVRYVCWQVKKVKDEGWTGIFNTRGSGYWHYDPSTDGAKGISNSLKFHEYIKLENANGVTPEVCAKLWLARYGCVALSYRSDSAVKQTIQNHTKYANTLYQMFLQT